MQLCHHPAHLCIWVYMYRWMTLSEEIHQVTQKTTEEQKKSVVHPNFIIFLLYFIAHFLEKNIQMCCSIK